jgi:RNA polymerase sigma-70 factor (ECF subfamily)
MQAQQAYIGGERNPIARTREQNAMDLQDAISRHLPALYSRAYRYVGDADDAEDAVQDALLSAYKHLDQFKATAKMTTWLTAIVINSALTQLRRRPRHSHVSLDERSTGEQDYSVSDRLADVRPSPEGACIQSESNGILMQSLKKLSLPLREAIQLRYFKGLSMREAARAMGVPEGTFKARLWRARAELKRLAGLRRSGLHK